MKLHDVSLSLINSNLKKKNHIKSEVADKYSILAKGKSKSRAEGYRFRPKKSKNSIPNTSSVGSLEN